jgi:glycerate kinase
MKEAGMSSKSKQLVAGLSNLNECAQELRRLVQRYEKINAALAARVDGGEPIVSALHAMQGPVTRRKVTEVLDKFENARHRVRRAMFALSSEQGASASEMGRALGISRQLAARLAREAEG